MAGEVVDSRRFLVVTPRLKIPLDEFRFTFSRSGGPGGQNVNKVNSKATLRWQARGSPSLSAEVRARMESRYRRRITEQGELLITSQRFRDAGRNAADCLDKLRELLMDIAVGPKVRKPTRPTRASNARRLDGKRQRQRKKQSRQPGNWF
jgi:ribosome-associated protein